jgi:TRAP-type C4-dicarboxylate transport system permease large subunit
VALVFYGIMTDSDIGKLFAAGLLPGILGILLYITAIKVVTRINPELGPKGERTGWRQRFAVLRGVWGILLLFGVVMGGIYFGVFSPTESAGIGAFGALAIGWLNGSLTPQTPRGVGPLITWLISGFRERAALAEFGRFLAAPVRRGRFDWKTIIDVLNESGRTSVAMFSILIGSLIFANFINVSNVPRELADWFLAIKVSPLVVVLIIVAVYIVLGCILESISMMLLTVPVFYPIILALDFGMTQQDALIWFGIVVVVVIEISLITPPIGLNVFVLKTLLPDVPVTRIFRGVLPFIAADVVRTAILIFVPVISLLLTRMM